MRDMDTLKDVVRIGIVSSIDEEKNTARVEIADTGTVTGNLKIVDNTPNTAEIKIEPWKPKIGQWVVCIFIQYGEGDGFILGGI